MNTAIVIPARLGSTRLPRKMLLAETGRTLVEHTFRAAQTSRLASRVIIATDDEEIVAAAGRFGAEVRLTRPDHRSGTDRVAEVARDLHDVDCVVNLQGDEPEMDGGAIDAAVQRLHGDAALAVATIACPLRERAALEDASCVKVVLNHAGQALYFSRSVIPHPRHGVPALESSAQPIYLQHLGLYAYRRSFLLNYHALPRSPLEECESLEQLRILQAGHAIGVAIVERGSKGIDTPADYEAFMARQRR